MCGLMMCGMMMCGLNMCGLDCVARGCEPHLALRTYGWQTSPSAHLAGRGVGK